MVNINMVTHLVLQKFLWNNSNACSAFHVCLFFEKNMVKRFYKVFVVQ